MPILDPLEPGDVPYPQYSVITTKPFRNIGRSVKKGVIYTPDSSGFVDTVIGTVIKGIFQSMSDFESDGNLPRDEGQFLGVRSRIIFTTATSFQIGENAYIVPDTTQVTNIVTTPLFIGKIYEIYTRDSSGNLKQTAVAGDKVIVETVGPGPAQV